MTISISIANPHTSRSGPKCLGDGRSRSTATSEATNTIRSTEPAGPRFSTRIASSVSRAGTPYSSSWLMPGSGRSRGRTRMSPVSRR